MHSAFAQCGSAGDPIVDITFGTSASPDFGGGTTTYRHIPLGQTAQGEGWYRLVTNINLGISSWHDLRDHTGNSGGLMLVVNADDDAGEFYRIRVSGLCEETRFRFSAWIANANRPNECGGQPIPPNVRFVIEDLNGNPISVPYATGEIAPSAVPQWLPFGFEFDTGNQTEFDLVLINDNPGGCGNDLAIDDIQFRPCGPSIELETQQGIWHDNALFFCDDALEPMVFDGTIEIDESYSANPVYLWQTRYSELEDWKDIEGETESQLTIVPQHGQWFRLTAAASVANLSKPLCRIVSDHIRVNTVYLDPMEEIVIRSGQAVTLNPQTNATQFNWGGPGLDYYHTQYPVASPTETTTYTLTASNEAGCEKTGEITVTVLQNLIIPNGFTPNGDGVNDVWEIDGLDEYPNAVVQVFNRWGNLVFSSSGYNTPWDGNANGNSLPAATYYYRISADLLDQPLSGAVTILR